VAQSGHQKQTDQCLFDTSVAGKWLEFLKDVMPGLNRVAVILDAVNAPAAAAYEKAIEAAAPAFPMQVAPANLRDAASMEATIEAFAHEPGGLVVPPSAFSVVYRDRIIALASRYRLPAMYPYSDFPRAGGLMSYGFNRSTLYQAAASYIVRILRGEKASDLPVQTPTKFELVINLKTAKTLGLTIPQSMLLVADEVIE
jgi:putative tryptophan/tyrosine transport system substrate-binding protein